MPQIVAFDQFNIPYAVQLGEELHGLGSYRHIKFDRMFAFETTRRATISPNYYCRMVQDDEGIYTGFVAGYVTPFTFSPKLLAIEIGWYVREGSQDRTKMAVKLMRGFVNWALDDRKAIQVQTGDVANINSLAVDTMYRHLGFQRFGSIYMISRTT